MIRGRSSAATVVAALLVPVAAAMVPARADIARPAEIDRMPVFAPDGLPDHQGQYPQSQNADISLILNPTTRRAYQVFQGIANVVSAFDLDTFEHLGSVEVPWRLAEPSPHVVDEAGARVFFPLARDSGFAGFAVLDEERFHEGLDAFRLLNAPSHPAYAAAVAGVRYEPRLGKLLLFLNPQRFPDGFTLGVTRGRQPLYTNFLAQWDPDSGEEWLHMVRPCSSAAIPAEMGPAATPFLNQAGTAINLTCASGEADVQLAQLQLAAEGVPTGEAITMPGASMVHDILVDPQRERVHLIAGQAYVVTLDWRKRQTVGTSVLSAVTPGRLLGAGIDPATGRLVFPVPRTTSAMPGVPDEPGGLFLVDGRRTPLPQALAYRHVTGEVPAAAAQVDPAEGGRPRRILVRHTIPGNPSVADPYWRVIEDPVPISQDPPAGDSDPTSDIDEVEGRTQRSYAAETSGYGSRIMVVGGLDGGQRIADSSGPCGAASRDLLAASIERAGLSTVTAAARAHPADADLGTQADLGDLGRCFGGGLSDSVRYPPPPDAIHGTGPGWESAPAECAGAGDDESSDGHRPGSRAAVACDHSGEQVTSDALYPGLDLGLVRVASSRTVTSLERDPDLGVVATVTSSAEGVEIAGVGTIGAVRSVAMSRANGRVPRAGDPTRTAWAVELCDVRTDSLEAPGCHPIEQAQALIDGLNQAGRGRLTFVRHRPDPELLEGSPGGYLAGVQKGLGDAAVAKLENGDELLTVAGLEIVVRTAFRTNETNVRRYIVQLAGVRAVTTYGITELPPGGEPVVREATADTVLGEVVAPAAARADSAGPVEVTAAPEDGGGGVPQLLEDIVRHPQRVLRQGLAFMLRSPLHALAALGVWATLASPAYLAQRRRRLGVAA